jgi:hypothetical protein
MDRPSGKTFTETLKRHIRRPPSLKSWTFTSVSLFLLSLVHLAVGQLLAVKSPDPSILGESVE